MKKILLVTLALILSKIANAQSWNLTLNSIGGGSPNFGTSSSHPINFYTAGTQRMTLTTNGELKINRLVGTGNRFLQADPNGSLVEWTGSFNDRDYVLHGDGSWKLAPVLADGVNLSTAANTKLGIGISSPATALDVSGDISATGTVKAPSGLMYTSTDGIFYNATDNVFILGKTGSPSPGVTGCMALPSPQATSWFYTHNGGFVTSQVNPMAAQNVNAYLRAFIAPTNGNGYVEVSGKDHLDGNNNSLNLNYYCGRNTNINTGNNAGYVNIGSTFPASKVFMGHFVNMNKHVEIGDPLAAINDPANVALDINVNGGKGLRFKTITDVIDLISIEKTDVTTQITRKAFSVQGDGFTEISSNNVKAFSIYNSNYYNYETFSVKANGYTEIKVYSPVGMPVPNYPNSSPAITFPRVFTIRDEANNKDIFVVRSDGKIYAREVEIRSTANFPDYVFNKEYNLMPLSDLDAYINTNKHLPKFEKGEYYEKNGINVNDLLLKQQEKIEELTLYIIEQEKRMKDQEKRLQALERTK